ncbi:hypothetical protein A5766_13940 [Gordonia sp. 852002-51296_SCH5728562-b]|nr:hypothetical protein A5766_13940 [Gordonia sp. 852002-51296_SCH5728562-b]
MDFSSDVSWSGAIINLSHMASTSKVISCSRHGIYFRSIPSDLSSLLRIQIRALSIGFGSITCTGRSGIMSTFESLRMCAGLKRF